MTSRTPLMKQYWEIKNNYNDALLLFRMGDFYETFYEDAKHVSDILGITLTARNYRDEKVPMAGFPIKSADSYIIKLVNTGKKIAICEQLEDAKDSVGLVKRGVVEVITPGTLMRETLLNEKKNNYIACYETDAGYCASLMDISTGEFKVISFESEAMLFDFLNKHDISEILQRESKSLLNISSTRHIPDYYYSLSECEYVLKKHFNVKDIYGIGFDRNESQIIVAGVLLQYLIENQKNNLKQITNIIFENYSKYMYIDQQTLRNLEIFKRTTGEYENSFLHIIDNTVTPMGARLLRYKLTHPFGSIDEINRHLNFVENAFNNNKESSFLRNELKGIGDIERIIARIKTYRASYRDLIQLYDALSHIITIKKHLKNISLNCFAGRLKDMGDILSLIGNSLNREKILSGKKERVIRKGFNEEYDKLIDMTTNAARKIKQLEEEEKQKTGINNLRIGYNNIAGYYIEITKSNTDKVPENYIWKQSLKNAQRYTNAQLREYEDMILHSDEKIAKLEKEIFENILKDIGLYYDDLKDIAYAIAQVDIIVSFALFALMNDYTKPVITNTKDIVINGGRHPVVEKTDTGRFIPNDLKMDKGTQIILLTGPNMSGKSTYLRQNALIIYMAHLGMFVPAKNAQIPLTDRIFTRIGASDDISRGVSTFMAEMLESANIINNMSDKSFIILDEIGRGTSTFDGLSIAWAIIEYLHECSQKPNTLFATHYHELTELENKLDRLKNYTASIRKTSNRIIYLKRIVEGKTDESYGIEVAKMAGFPQSIIKNGYAILHVLKENEQNIRDKIKQIEQLQLFDEKQIKNPVIEYIKTLNIDSISPIEALLELDKLKKMLKDE